ncbi:MAG: SUMF1/EgtB/PvdO family nonheme iron enzyme [candidate division KSB1 bacterium]|nr:SUMF1/EgtB/PvdO family nonheme iron enzyme [candidate division KSB1 bacterium]
MFKKLIIVLIIISSCQKMPHSPENDNRLDPMNPVNGGDPFELQAVYTGDGIALSWSPLQRDDIKGYNIFRGMDDIYAIQFQDSVNAVDTTWIDSSIVKGHSYYYRLTVELENGTESSASHISPVYVNTEPVILINDGNRFARESLVRLTILAPSAAEMWLSHDSTFAGNGWEAYHGKQEWQLLPGEGSRAVYAKVKDDSGNVSPFFMASIIVDISRPTAIFNVLPDTGMIGEPFHFNAGGSRDNMSGPSDISLRWDWENDGFYDTEWLLNRETTHTYTKEGEVTVKLMIRDGAGWRDSTLQKIYVKTPPMVYIPAGEFVMGSRPGEGDGDEHPEHTVYLDAFWMDTYEVTNAQFAQFLTDGNAHRYNAEMQILDNGDGSYSPIEGFENHPVVFVSYSDADAYARWLGKSLPTEAQWERSARYNDHRIYPWGDLLESNIANYWRSGDPCDMNETGTTPVGYYDGSNHNGYQTKDGKSFSGIFDLSGNVWEWCLDWYKDNYYGSSPVENPTGPADGLFRVIRGGSWVDEAYYLRAACRSYRLPDASSAHVGFRCVKVASN